MTIKSYHSNGTRVFFNLRRIASSVAGLALIFGSVMSIMAQVPNEKPRKICRTLVPGDPYHPKYSSCCDTSDGRSRWTRKSDQSILEFDASCQGFGVLIGPPHLALTVPPAIISPVIRNVIVLEGRYQCFLGTTGSIEVNLYTSGRYRASDDSVGNIDRGTRDVGFNGEFTKYPIRGGSLDGFYFLQWDNGKLQLGRTGWGQCERL